MPAQVTNEVLDCRGSGNGDVSTLCISSNKTNVTVIFDYCVQHLVKEYNWTYTRQNGLIYGSHRTEDRPRIQLKNLIAEYLNPGRVVRRVLVPKVNEGEQLDYRGVKLGVELEPAKDQTYFETQLKKLEAECAAYKLSNTPKPVKPVYDYPEDEVDPA